MRRLFITSMVNDPGVSAKESLVSARHTSVAAQLPYQHRDGVSEYNKFKALGLVTDDSKKDNDSEKKPAEHDFDEDLVQIALKPKKPEGKTTGKYEGI